ncbi:MAG: DUF4403 family protein, partial [Bacteroidota bacterium]
MKHFLFSILILACLLSSCASKKVIKPMERYKEILEQQEISKVNIPLRLSKVKIHELINSELPDPLYEDDDMSDDNLLVKATKVDSIEVGLEGKHIFYVIPLDIWVKKDFGLTEVEGEGKIKLSMKTTYDVDSNWQIISNTELIDHDWLEKPQVKVGFLKLPVEAIADIVINQAKEKITKQIDDKLSDSNILRKEVEKAWDKIKEPILISEKDSLWLLLSPKTVGLSPPKTINDTIHSNVFIECKPLISVGVKTTLDSLFPLPEMQWQEEGEETFSLNLLTEISYEEAERLAKEYALGKTFTEGKRSVTIEDIKLYGQGDKIVVDALVSGSYKGSIYMIGKPVYNAAENVLEVKDLNYELKTKNFLVNSLGWLV